MMPLFWMLLLAVTSSYNKAWATLTRIYRQYWIKQPGHGQPPVSTLVTTSTRNQQALNKRYDAVSALLENNAYEPLQTSLKSLSDIERIVARVGLGRPSQRLCPLKRQSETAA